MTRTLDIPAGERSKLHLFALNTEPTETDADATQKTGAPAAKLLNIPDLDADYAEVIAVDDIAELGLLQYLIDGYDIDPNDLRAHRTRINALEGHALIVLSLAFQDQAHTISLGPALTHIATLPTQGPDWSSDRSIETQSALPPAPAPKRPSNAAMMGRIATYTLVLMFALTGLMIWIAG